VKAAIDQIVASSGSDKRIMLIGRSGGGFTAYLAGALDHRVDFVASIAGGTPLSIRLAAPWEAYELGDYEQYAPHLYDVVTHENLMVAAGTRGSFFAYNARDTCCFQIGGADPLVGYLRHAGIVQGKQISVFSDPTFVGHALSPAGYDAFEAAMADWFR